VTQPAASRPRGWRRPLGIGPRLQLLVGAGFVLGVGLVLAFQTVTHIEATLAERQESHRRIVASLAGPASGAIGAEDPAAIYAYMEIIDADPRAAALVFIDGSTVAKSQQSLDHLALDIDELSRNTLEAISANAMRVSEVGQYELVSAPIQDSADRVIGGFGMAWSTDGLLDSFWATTRQQLAMLVGIAALILIAVALFADRIIIRPIVAIAGAMDRLSATSEEQDSAPRLPDYSARRDEIGALSRALEQLHESDHEVRQLNVQLDAALANMGAGLCMFDRDQRLIISNRQYATLYRLDPAAVVPGVTLRDLLEQRIAASQFPAQTAEEFIAESERRCTGGGPSVWKVNLPDGRIVEMQFRPMAGGGWLSTHDDVTERERNAEELRRRRDDLQDLVDGATAKLLTQAEDLKRALAAEKKLNQIQRQFVSMASHEFRTPLTIIDATAQGLKRRFEKLTPEQAGERIDKIRGAVRRMTRLVESTLMAARAEEGKLLVEIEDCDIAGTVHGVCERHQDMAPKHRIACNLIDLPSTIRADVSAVDQILTNLLSNAVKYAPDSPEISVVARGGGDQVTISVTDHGVGIGADDLPHIFERFFRAKTSTGIPGTGIGLNLTKMLVEMHDGSISLESSIGDGSIFTVRLPVDGPRQSAQRQDQAA